MGWEGKVLAHFWLEASDNIFFILVFIFQNKTIARQRQRGGKRMELGESYPSISPFFLFCHCCSVSFIIYSSWINPKGCECNTILLHLLILS